MEDESLQALRSMQHLQHDPTPMHIFDVRRSASVTELWKEFEYKPDARSSNGEEGSGAASTQNQSETPTAGNAAATSAPGDEPQPLLAAFEAELADILSTTESSQNRSPQPESPPTVEPSAAAEPERTLHPIEVLAAQIVRHLISGAGIVQSELRTRMPELQRQLHHAQQSLPEHIGTSLQTVLTALENHMRNLTGAFNNLPEGGRHLAEEAVHAGRPVAQNAAGNLRMLASEFNDAGRTLFAAFENELRRAGPRRPNSSTTGAQGTEPCAETPQPSASTEAASRGDEESQARDSAETERGTTNSAQPKVSGLGTSEGHGTPAEVGDANPQAQREGPVNSAPIPSGHHHPPSPLASSRPNRWAPPFWPPRPAWSGMPRFYPPAPPPPYPGRSWPSQWPPRAPHQWFGARQSPAGHGPQNFSEPPPTSSASAHLRSAGTQTSPANETLFIGNVGFDVTERMIQDVFASKGFIVNVDLPKDTLTGKHAGFGYVHFPSIYPAMAAMEALQGAHIDGHAINLEFSDDSPIERVSASQSSRRDMDTGVRNAAARHPSTGLNNDKRTAAQNPTTSKPWAPARPASGSLKEQFKERAARQDRGGTIERRKSVAFREPASSAKDAAMSKAENGMAELLDSTSDDPAFSARFPSLLPEGRPQQTGTVSKKESLPRLSPESEMTRFPPVSQLEAHLFANQQQARTAGSTQNAQNLNNGGKDRGSQGTGPSIYHVPSHEAPVSLPRPRTVPDTPERPALEELLQKADTSGPTQISQNLNNGGKDQGNQGAGASIYNVPSHEAPDSLSRTPRTVPDTPERLKELLLAQPQRHHDGHGLRRSNTTMFAHSGSKHSDPSVAGESNGAGGLRRRATERHSLHSSARRSSEMDTWARLNRRERARVSPSRNIPGSFPVDEPAAPSFPTAQTAESNEKVDPQIERCVSALVDMGYGTVENGGRSRMAVYAAAANGDLWGAIEMIEEERKAYGRP